MSGTRAMEPNEFRTANKSLERTQAGHGAWPIWEPWAACAAQFRRWRKGGVGVGIGIGIGIEGMLHGIWS